MEDGVGGATTSGVVVVVVTLGGGFEWWQWVEMGGQVRCWRELLIVIGRHHVTMIAGDLRRVCAEKAGFGKNEAQRMRYFRADKLEEVSTRACEVAQSRIGVLVEMNAGAKCVRWNLLERLILSLLRRER